MSLWGWLTGASAGGAATVMNGVGDAAIKIRSAITGDLPPEKKAELEKHLSELDARLSEAQNEVNKAEAQSGNMFIAGWRPAAGWICNAGLAYSFLIYPVLSWASTNYGLTAPPAIDTGLLVTMLGGMLGLGGIRSFEKVKKVAR